MHRIYCPHSDLTSQEAFIDDKDELHHLRNVLRLKGNANVQLFDGKGTEAQGILQSVTAKQATVEIESYKTTKRTAPLIVLACAVPKKSKFELIIEKATELGVDEIIPLRTERTEVKLPENRLSKKQLRFKSVAVSAARQSQRSTVPKIHPISDFESALDHLIKTTTPIIPSLTDNTDPLFKALKNIKPGQNISFLIGPEGDFSPEEYHRAHEAGCMPVTLGNTVLRVETAAICALSCANLFFRS